MKEIRKLLQEITDNRHEVVCLSRKDRLTLDDNAEISRMNRRHQDLTVTLEAAVRELVRKLDGMQMLIGPIELRAEEFDSPRDHEMLDRLYREVYSAVKR